jgi:hypothetical protein
MEEKFLTEEEREILDERRAMRAQRKVDRE